MTSLSATLFAALSTLVTLSALFAASRRNERLHISDIRAATLLSAGTSGRGERLQISDIRTADLWTVAASGRGGGERLHVSESRTASLLTLLSLLTTTSWHK